MDENSVGEYKLPDRVTDSTLDKSVETFTCLTSSEGEPAKVKLTGGSTESSVGSAASQAMEILYSSEDNG